MPRYLPIQGTDGWDKDQWWKAGSPFTTAMARVGWDLLQSEDPFVWSTDLDGANPLALVCRPWQRREAKHRDWEAGGLALHYFLKDVPYEDRNLVSHSHGLQVVLYAARHGSKIRSLIDISGPVRGDMSIVTDMARPQIARWVHVYDQKTDWIAWAGQLFDGRLAVSRAHPEADINISLQGVGHSGLLRDPALFPLLPTHVFPEVRL